MESVQGAAGYEVLLCIKLQSLILRSFSVMSLIVSITKNFLEGFRDRFITMSIILYSYIRFKSYHISS